MKAVDIKQITNEFGSLGWSGSVGDKDGWEEIEVTISPARATRILEGVVASYPQFFVLKKITFRDENGEQTIPLFPPVIMGGPSIARPVLNILKLVRNIEYVKLTIQNVHGNKAHLFDFGLVGWKVEE